MSIITDTFFGGAERKAAKQQAKGLAEQQRLIREGTQQARGDIMELFPQASQLQQQGFQGALDIFGQALPQQAQTFQQGNVAAQQQLLNALPMQQAAILGQPINYNQLQATQLQQPDLSFLQTQLPQIQAQQQAEAEAAERAEALAEFKPIINDRFQFGGRSFLPDDPGDSLIRKRIKQILE